MHALLPLRRPALWLGIPLFLAGIVGVVLAGAVAWALAAILAAAACLAFGLGSVESLKGYQYTAWIVVAVVAGMTFPERCLHLGDIDLRNPWLILIVVQLVMFGMGTQMKLQDLSGVARNPRGVAVGLFCQFTIMPTIGFLLTLVFDFPPEIAAGVILIGSCSSGLASNVMAYLARANLALSVTVTAVATLLAPLATPFLMKLFAGTLVEVAFVGMMLSIIKIVIVPIGAAMLSDYLGHASAQGWRVVKLLAAFSAAWLGTLVFGGWDRLEQFAPSALLPSLSIVGFLAGAVLFGLTYFLLRQRFAVFDKLMPYFSMAGIIYFTTVTTAAGRDDLLNVGLLLFLAAVIHNSAGYFFGYWLSRLLGLDRNSARSVSLEVGLQNGGMASGLAGGMGKLGTLGLASAVFSPWMNISGSILANYWAKRPVKEN